MKKSWNKFTDSELKRAVELMIAPSDLAIREAAVALLEVFGYSGEEVREQLDGGEYLNDGPVLSGLETDHPAIVQIGV